MTILYIDDDRDDIDMLKDVVQNLDATISFIAYTDGRDALDFLHHTPVLPDFIFVDMNMPLMSGKEILKYLKQDKRLSVIPVVMYTTTSSEREVKEFYKDGALLYLQKATTVKAMEADIAAFLMNAKLDKGSTFI